MKQMCEIKLVRQMVSFEHNLEAAPEVFSNKRRSEQFCKIQRKTPVPESLF